MPRGLFSFKAIKLLNMKKNNLQTTLSAVAWIFMVIGSFGVVSGLFNIFDKYTEVTAALTILMAGVSAVCFSLVFFALSYIIAKLDDLIAQKQVESFVHSMPINSEFDEWKKQNPTKSINEFYAMKK